MDMARPVSAAPRDVADRTAVITSTLRRAILSAASRGAAETGRAMSMRGALDAVGEVGGSVPKRRTRLGWVDACVFAATLLGVGGVVACTLML